MGCDNPGMMFASQSHEELVLQSPDSKPYTNANSTASPPSHFVEAPGLLDNLDTGFVEQDFLKTEAFEPI